MKVVKSVKEAQKLCDKRADVMGYYYWAKNPNKVWVKRKEATTKFSDNSQGRAYLKKQS